MTIKIFKKKHREVPAMGKTQGSLIDNMHALNTVNKKGGKILLLETPTEQCSTAEYPV